MDKPFKEQKAALVSEFELSYDDETIAQSLRAELLGIQRGDLPDRHGWITII